LVLFWFLADRWGGREAGQVVLKIPLQHELLSALVSAERASVSRSLKALSRRGQISRRADGYWVLHGVPPQDLGELILIQRIEGRNRLAWRRRVGEAHRG
jgi:hypothetical protein